MVEIRSTWLGFSSAGVVAFILLLVSAFVSAERSLKDEPSKKIETENVESDYFLKVINFLWKSDQSGYHHVWPVSV